MRGKRTPQAVVEEIKALAPIYDSVAQLARNIGLPEQTVRDIVRGGDDQFVELRAQQKREMILQAHKVAKDILNEMGRMKARSLSEAATSYGILVDKAAQLAGESNKWSYQ